MSNLRQQNHRKTIIDQDKLRRQTPFDPQKQLYPADLFVLVGLAIRPNLSGNAIHTGTIRMGSILEGLHRDDR